uniref:Secreted protein n=1 Tax=Plectus sambesii TaxID=2011161 RepID=A0A914XP05_9BILA
MLMIGFLVVFRRRAVGSPAGLSLARSITQTESPLHNAVAGAERSKSDLHVSCPYVCMYIARSIATRQRLAASKNRSRMSSLSSWQTYSTPGAQRRPWRSRNPPPNAGAQARPPPSH